MKKIISITFAVLAMVFITSMKVNDVAPYSSRKYDKVSKPISLSVMKIAENSCLKCHTKGGKMKALFHLNLSKWDKFSPNKQAKKAKEMCEMVSEGKMPPEGFLEKNPGVALNAEQVKIICDWANSIP